MVFELVFWQGANEAVHNPTIFKQQNYWNALYLKLSSCGGVLIQFDLREFDVAGKLRSEFVEYRQKASTVAAPGCPEKHGRGSAKAEDFTGKSPVRYLYRVLGESGGGGEGRSTFAAYRLPTRSGGRDAIFSTAIWATDDEVVLNHCLLTPFILKCSAGCGNNVYG